MGINYPAGLDEFADPTSADNLGDTLADGRKNSERQRDLGDAVVAIETELGTNPSGTDATVDARLDRMQTEVDGAAADASAAASSGTDAVNTHLAEVDPHPQYQQQSEGDARYVRQNGSTPMTGELEVPSVLLDADPTTDLQAATKGYVDTAVADLAALQAVAVYASSVEPSDKRSGVVWLDTSAGAPSGGGVTLIYEENFDGTVGAEVLGSDIGASDSGTSTQCTFQDTPTMGHGDFMRCAMNLTRPFTISLPASTTEIYVRFLMRLNDVVASNSGVFIDSRGGGSPIAQLQQVPGGIRPRDGASVNGTNEAVTEDTIVRVEWRVALAGTTGQTLRVWYDPTSTGVPDIDQDHTTDVNVGATQIDYVRCGVLTAGGTETIDIDELALSTEGWIGPVV